MPGCLRVPGSHFGLLPSSATSHGRAQHSTQGRAPGKALQAFTGVWRWPALQERISCYLRCPAFSYGVVTTKSGRQLLLMPQHYPSAGVTAALHGSARLLGIAATPTKQLAAASQQF